MGADERDKKPGRRPVAFISHHSSQEKTARHLKAILERNGVTGWMAPDDIDPGVAFDQAIIEQVEQSDLIVLLFCAQSDRSRHVKRELMMAENNKKLIYPVRLEDIDAKGLAYWLNDYQWIDWIDRRDATIERMIETIKRHVGSGAAAPGEPAEAPSPAAAAEPAAATGGLQPPAPVEPLGLSARPKRDRRGFEMTRTRWIAAGGAAAALLAILLLVVGIGGNRDAPRAATGIRAGAWESSFEYTDAQFPDLSGDMALQARRQVGNEIGNRPVIGRACISAEQAADPDPDLILPDLIKQFCTISSSEIGNGAVDIRGACQMQGNSQPAAMTMTGTYDMTSFDSRIVFNSPATQYGPMALVANYSARRTGDCN